MATAGDGSRGNGATVMTKGTELGSTGNAVNRTKEKDSDKEKEA